MIYHTPHQANFSIRANAVLQDNNLSDATYRLLNHLLSKPSKWSLKYLRSASPQNAGHKKTALKAAFIGLLYSEHPAWESKTMQS